MAIDMKQPHEERQYLELVSQIIARGEKRKDRTGTGTLSLFAPPQMRFSLSDDDGYVLPLLTTKQVFTRGIIEELLWFVNASTSSKLLSEKGVRIWDGNGSREFLDKMGFTDREDGDLGPVYGFQWRHFGAEYKTAKDDYTGQGVDQLAEVIKKIKTNPTDRRIILSAWNPADIPKMALPPCHMFCQFYVNLETGGKPKLSCLMYQRSADLGLGVPFNIASYALLTQMIAFVTDTTPHELIMQLGDAHVYLDHVDVLKKQLERIPTEPFPRLTITRPLSEIKDIDGFQTTDFKITGYKHQGKLEMAMSV